MPKNKKPAGARPAKNYDPSYARGGRGAASAAPKSGARSPGHRGYRPVEEVPKKARWSAEERAATGRGPRRSDGAAAETRAPRREYDDRPARGGYDRDDRAPRRDYGDARPARREYNTAERPTRSFDRTDRTDRPARTDRATGGDRPARGYDRDDRAPRRDAGADRPARGYDRPTRSFDRPDRTDRPARSFDRDDRAPRRDAGTDRPARGFDRDQAPRRDFGADRPDRPARREYNTDRPARGFDRDQAPRRDFRADRPARSFDRDDRAPRRDFGADRPTRSFDRDDRAPRRDGDRPGFHSSDRSSSQFYPSRDEKARFTPQDDVVLERLEADAILATDVEGVTFADLGLGGNIVRELAELGAALPFPIQAATIPDVLAGKDVLGRGRTGSGKTIAFGAPTVEKLMENGGGKRRQPGRRPRALILAPTRELALQIDRTVQPIARAVGLFTTQIYGGVPQHRQVGALQRGVDIVIGTPGRIEDLIEQGRLDLSEVTITVLDEADHMCDLGFLEPVQRILRHTAEGGQRLLFSATLDKGVATLVHEFLVDPAVHEVAGEDQASSTIDHRVLVIEHRDKGAIIEQLADRNGKTLVFARTRAFAEQLAEQLDDAGIPAVSLHGDLNQSRRTRNLEKLTSGRVNVLVATDVAARGIHVDDIDLVIQADAPDEYKTYLHRSGRTGRAGKQGTVVTLIPKQRRRRMDELLGRAEIEADYASVVPGDAVLSELARL
ncbi:DEAD/DEAH box helicase [Compostimonas suwonensis]|uniref:Superfamily II DNA/RNA helicase n=1 Tax=Compostimonas suwonensis TaxID=1048394 RepID=A0A2M9C4T6_9MICO|nr:DEAD/DEAH box helicase [Compostimonas suwonensis]PJJ65522.1 superfamily II DNA/RNA helicase [Compostimonas suwonensis]